MRGGVRTVPFPKHEPLRCELANAMEIWITVLDNGLGEWQVGIITPGLYEVWYFYLARFTLMLINWQTSPYYQ